MSKWNKTDIVFVALTLDNFVIGEVVDVIQNDDTAYLKNPCDFKIQMTQGGPSPALMPLGLFLENIVERIDIAPCQYLYAGKVDSQIAEMYNEYKQKLAAAQSGLILPTAQESQALRNTKNGNIIQFSPKS